MDGQYQLFRLDLDKASKCRENYNCFKYRFEGDYIKEIKDIIDNKPEIRFIEILISGVIFTINLKKLRMVHMYKKEYKTCKLVFSKELILDSEWVIHYTATKKGN